MVAVYGSGEVGDGTSKCNRTEAEATARVVASLQRAGVPAADLGVISPSAFRVAALVPDPIQQIKDGGATYEMKELWSSRRGTNEMPVARSQRRGRRRGGL